MWVTVLAACRDPSTASPWLALHHTVFLPFVFCNSTVRDDDRSSAPLHFHPLTLVILLLNKLLLHSPLIFFSCIYSIFGCFPLFVVQCTDLWQVASDLLAVTHRLHSTSTTIRFYWAHRFWLVVRLRVTSTQGSRTPVTRVLIGIHVTKRGVE